MAMGISMVVNLSLSNCPLHAFRKMAKIHKRFASRWITPNTIRPPKTAEPTGANHRFGMVKSQFVVWRKIPNVLKDKINVSLQFRQVRIGFPKNNIIRECADLTFPLDNTLNA
ncbi:hypothetical protein TNCV_768541 [Trichonephila clavipes]|nr:hypothetical protein TNCV_768541 [Trichonephila clavipes]